MKITTTAKDGLVRIEPEVHGDHRGFFMESYHAAKLAAQGISIHFVQENHSLSEEVGVLRGLHYQLNPHAQTKLVRVISGAIYDVAVDIRRLKSGLVSRLVPRINSSCLFRRASPPGFCTLEPRTQVQYKVDAYYSPLYDRGILWSEPAIGIAWPTACPILSAKDEKHPLLKDAEVNFLKKVYIPACWKSKAGAF